MRMTLEGLEPNSLYFVQLRTKYRGATSLWSRRFDLETLKDTLKPSPVTNLAGSFNEGNLSISWAAPTTNEDGSTLYDLKDYVVTINPLPADTEWSPAVIYAEGTRAAFTKEDNAAAFGHYRPGLRITVQARDIVGNLSEPVEIIESKAKPKAPTDLTWAAVDNSFRGTWTAPTQNLDNSPYTDSDGYELTVVYVSENGMRNELVRIEPSNAFTLSYEENKAAFGGPSLTPKARGKLTLEVRARDSVGQLSEPVIATAQNNPPKAPTGVTAKGILNGVRLEWNANDQADSVSHYEIWVAPNATAVGEMTTRVPGTFYIYDTANYDTDHFFYIKAVDNFDLVSEPGRPDPYTAVRPVSPYGVDAEPPATPTGTITVEPYSTDPADPAAVRVSWPAVTSSDLAGYHVAYSLDTNPRVWNYRDVVDPADTSIIITPLRPLTRHIVRLRSYDRSINTSPWSVEAAGMSSDSTSDFEFSDISSDISVIAGGTLRSENFVESDPSFSPPFEGRGWRLMSSGLDIESGRVNARVIRAGELRSSETVPTGVGQTEEGQPLWSLNLGGNLTVRNARIRGQLLVGAPDLDSTRVSIASYNYGRYAGDQWAIRGDGRFEVRGSGPTGGFFQLSSGGIAGYDLANNRRVLITNQGQFEFQTTNGGLVFDDNGLRLFEGSTLSIDLNRSGRAYFRGRIDAAEGKIGGWELTHNQIIKGNLSFRSDLGEVKAGAFPNQAGIRGSHGIWAGAPDMLNYSPPFSVDLGGFLVAKSGRIAGFSLSETGGLSSGFGSDTVAMRGGVGIWTGASFINSAATRMYPNGRFYTENAYVQGEILSTRFRSNGSSAGTSNYIEMGMSGTNDPVDEIRFFHRGTKSSIRNPDTWPGSILISLNSRRFWRFDTNGTLFSHGNTINLGGTGQMHGVASINSGNYWNPGGTAYCRPATSTKIEIGNSSSSRFLSVSNVSATGTKTFVIDHPTKPENYLVHAAIEGPTSDVYYRGQGRLEPDYGYLDDGSARVARTVVTLPDYFENLTEKEGRTVVLTPILEVCEICGEFLAPSMGCGPVVDGQFKVYALAGYVHDHAKFYWEVKAIRKGEVVEVEPLKSEHMLNGQGPYTYLTKRPAPAKIN